jgi:hypothetical protein
LPVIPVRFLRTKVNKVFLRITVEQQQLLSKPETVLFGRERKSGLLAATETNKIQPGIQPGIRVLFLVKGLLNPLLAGKKKVGKILSRFQVDGTSQQ